MIRPLVRPTDRNREWKLMETITYKDIVIPYGFIFDGASIPIGLRWLFPHGGRKFGPACIHDYCYRTKDICTKREADLHLKEAMLSNGVSKIKVELMYWAVRLFGKGSYHGEIKEK